MPCPSNALRMTLWNLVAVARLATTYTLEMCESCVTSAESQYRPGDSVDGGGQVTGINQKDVPGDELRSLPVDPTNLYARTRI